jgi:hypothetical protein
VNRLLTFALLAAVLAGGCGRKGPPLAPLVRVPAAAADFSARRLGDVVYLQLTIPGRNQDNSTPADISRVEVYGCTGASSSAEQIVARGMLVASLPVRQPSSSSEEKGGSRAGEPSVKGGRAAEARAGFGQNDRVVLSETITAVLARPVAEAALADRSRSGEAPVRTYVAVGVNHRGRRGAFSTTVSVPVSSPAAPPGDLRLTYSETAVTLTWSPPSGTRPTRQPGLQAGEPQGAAPKFNVYLVRQETAPPGQPGPAPPVLPAPVNAKPLEKTAFTDSGVEPGAERCYVVRTVSVQGTLQQESDASPVACVTPRDTFPPAAPRALSAVAGETEISLSWSPNDEPDLAGYIVLRGEAAEGRLEPLVREPIQETTYTDRSAKPGVRYVYAVTAVDRATPPNVSAQSNRVEAGIGKGQDGERITNGE